VRDLSDAKNETVNVFPGRNGYSISLDVATSEMINIALACVAFKSYSTLCYPDTMFFFYSL